MLSQYYPATYRNKERSMRKQKIFRNKIINSQI